MIQFLIYILVYPFIYLISILPFRILYLLSDFFYFIIYYLIGYRKEVVLQNLRIAFPKKSEKEIKKIRKKFFRHFVDIFMEMIKAFTITEQQLSKRFKIINPEALTGFMKKHPSNILMASHHGNYEWLIILKKYFDQPLYVAYKKLENKYFNELAKKSRTRLNATLVTTLDFKILMEKVFNEKGSGVYGLISDQNPLPKKAQYWRDFFDKRVPVYTGAETLSKKYNYPVAYIDVRKIKRGFYECTFRLITETPRELPDFEITDRFFKLLEEQVSVQPEYYFWTHKRFKHVGKEPDKFKKNNFI